MSASLLAVYIGHAARRGEVWATLPARGSEPPIARRAVLVHWPRNGGGHARVEFPTGRRHNVRVEHVELILPEVAS